MTQLPAFIPIRKLYHLWDKDHRTTRRMLESLDVLTETGKRSDGNPIVEVDVDLLLARFPRLADRLHMMQFDREEEDGD